MINDIAQLTRLKEELVLFLLVGVVCFFMEIALLFIFTEYAHWYYLYSSAMAFIITVIVNYFMCTLLVFKSSSKSKKQFMFFVITSVMGLVINQICMYIFVKFICVYYLFAKLISAVIVTFWNYVSKKSILKT